MANTTVAMTYDQLLELQKILIQISEGKRAHINDPYYGTTIALIFHIAHIELIVFH